VNNPTFSPHFLPHNLRKMAVRFLKSIACLLLSYIPPGGNSAIPHYQSRYRSALLYIFCARCRTKMTDYSRIYITVLHSAWTSLYTDPFFPSFYQTLEFRYSAVFSVNKWGVDVPGLESLQGKTFCDFLCGNTDPYSRIAQRAGERDSSVGIATDCWLNGPGIELHWGARFLANV